MKSLYVISAVGKDQPGLVHSVTSVLAKLGINIIDVEARAVRGHFMLFIVVDLSTSKSSYEEMIVKLDPISSNFNFGLRAEPYEEGRRKSDKEIMLLTVMGGDQTGIVAMLSEIFFENNINIESIKMIARGDYIAMEIALDTSDLNDMVEFRKVLYKFADKTGLDVSLRGDDIFQKPKKVVVFDCDSTLIQSEVIDELSKMANVSERVKDMTERAMKGELDFKQAIKERVRLLKGLPVEQLELLAKTIRLTPGTEELISMLHFMGYKVAVISGGFSFFTDYLKNRLPLDYVYTNELVIRDGEITGDIEGDIIDAEKKGEIIKEIAKLENISVDQIVAVGDGANDRFMLENAGLAIAFSPKEILKKYSDGIINNDNIFGLLYFLGVPESHLKELRKNQNRRNLPNS